MIPKMVLHPCYRCGCEVLPMRTVAMYKWRAAVKCQNHKCRMLMLGDIYGDNGVLDPLAKSYEGEETAFRMLAQRWNAHGYNIQRSQVS